MRIPYWASVLSYCHDYVRGESVNIGLLMVAQVNGQPKLQFKIEEQASARLSLFFDFEEYDKTHYQSMAESLKKKAERLRDNTSFPRLESEVAYFTHKIVRDDLIFKWSEPISGIAEYSELQYFNNLYAELVSIGTVNPVIRQLQDERLTLLQNPNLLTGAADVPFESVWAHVMGLSRAIETMSGRPETKWTEFLKSQGYGAKNELLIARDAGQTLRDHCEMLETLFEEYRYWLGE